VTLAQLLGSGEFWAALAGALAAFLLGSAAQWRSATNAKRAAGNVALITLSQMFSLTKNLNDQLFVIQVPKVGGLLGRDPYFFELKSAVALPDQVLTLPLDQLGFLADSHDPDVLNRLLTVERAFSTMLKLVERHERLHLEFQRRLSAHDQSGTIAWQVGEIRGMIGVDLWLQLENAVMELRTGLPETVDHIIRVSGQVQNRTQHI